VVRGRYPGEGCSFFQLTPNGELRLRKTTVFSDGAHKKKKKVEKRRIARSWIYESEAEKSLRSVNWGV